MNKKFIVGLSSLAIAGTFLACGDGEVYEFDERNDGPIMFGYVESNDTSIMVNAVNDCKGDPACAGLMGQAPSTPVVSSSSIAQQPQQPVVGSSSSAAAPTFRSSSSKIVFASSDSQGGASSSSIAVVPGGTGDIGTCAPTTTPITKGESTTWKFSFNNKNSAGLTAKDIIGYDFTWNFDANASKPSEVITGLSPTGAITYKNSGLAKATVSISKGAAAYSVTCSDLQVNGAPITGCKCAATAATADVADGGIAGWTVAGCTSVGANITGYTWTGATGAGESASYTFTEKGQTLKPSVSVANDDNTVQLVECDEVKAIDSNIPDYEILANQAAGKIAIPAGATSVHVKVPVSGQSCVIFCETTWTQELEGKLNMTVGGVKATGAYNVTVSLPVDQCDDDMIDFDLSAPATCGVQ